MEKKKSKKNKFKRVSFSETLEDQLFAVLSNNEYENTTKQNTKLLGIEKKNKVVPEPTPETCPEPIPETCPEPTKTIKRIILSKQQTKVYKCLVGWKNFGKTTGEKIEQYTGVPRGYVYKICRKLRNYGLIKYEKVNSVYKGMKFSIVGDRDREIIFFGEENQYYHYSVQSSVQSNYISSSTTTTLKNILGKNLDFSYWKQKGLSEKQFIQWMDEVKSNEETLLRYLSYCRFEMVDLGVEESKPVDNVLNWFYKILERNGSYPKPKGYKSFEEKRIEEERELL